MSSLGGNANDVLASILYFDESTHKSTIVSTKSLFTVHNAMHKMALTPVISQQSGVHTYLAFFQNRHGYINAFPLSVSKDSSGQWTASVDPLVSRDEHPEVVQTVTKFATSDKNKYFSQGNETMTATKSGLPGTACLHIKRG